MLWNPRVTMMIPIVISAFGTVLKSLKSWKLENESKPSKRKHCWDRAEYKENTEKGPGDLRRLAATQTSTKDRQLTLVWKTLKE